VAEDSHMTLKEYFDAADQRREKERQKKSQLLGILMHFHIFPLIVLYRFIASLKDLMKI
jgi:hypothetical protein